MTESEKNIELMQNQLSIIKDRIIDSLKLIEKKEKNYNFEKLKNDIKLIVLLENLFKHYPNVFGKYYSNIDDRVYSFSIYVDILEDINNKIENLYTGLPFFNIPRFENIINNLNSIINNIIELTEIPKNEISFVYSSISDIEEINDMNNFVTKVKVKEKSIDDLESEIKNLQKQIDKNDSTELKKELLKKEEELNKSIKEKEELEKKAKEYDTYIDERKKIISAIEKLNIPAKVLDDEKEHYLGTRKFFNLISGIMFGLSFCIFMVLIFSVHFDLSYVKNSEKINLSFYFFTVFPILFPTFVGFLFIRQSNINSKEIEKINKRFVLIHEINQSLLALVEINRGKGMDNKTEKVVDKLISNILNYSTQNNKNENEESNILELNESIDKLIDTIDKKLTVIGKPE